MGKYLNGIIIILSFIPYMQNANGYMSIGLSLLKNDPVGLADTVVVGTLTEDSAGKQYLLIERGWTLYPEKIYVPSTVNFDKLREGYKKMGVTGQKYFLYMSKEAEDKEKYIGPMVLNLLKDSKLTIEKFAKKRDFTGIINPSWQFCESDIECVKSKNQCGKQIGINKKYEKDYLSFLKQKKYKTDCSKSVTAELATSNDTKCVENFCS